MCVNDVYISEQACIHSFGFTREYKVFTYLFTYLSAHYNLPYLILLCCVRISLFCA